MSSDLGRQLRLWGDELRAVSVVGLRWSEDDPHPYHAERYEHVQRVAAELFAAADVRPASEIRRTLFRALTHVAPLPGAEAAVFDDQHRLLLIRRSDDRLWAMPGGALDLGETPAEGAVRETAEETGVVVEPVALAGVFDSRRCGSRSSLQMYGFVFECRPVGMREASTPAEVLDLGWFGPDELPDLSPGHTVRVPDAFRFHRDRIPHFD